MWKLKEKYAKTSLLLMNSFCFSFVLVLYLFALMNVWLRYAISQPKRLLLDTMAQRFIRIDRVEFTNNPVRFGVVNVTLIFHIGYIQGKISMLFLGCFIRFFHPMLTAHRQIPPTMSHTKRDA